MGRSSRKLRRRATRMPEPMLRELAPGVYDVALPIPLGMPKHEAQVLAQRFAAELHARYGVTLGPVHVCTPDTCTHIHRP